MSKEIEVKGFNLPEPIEVSFLKDDVDYSQDELFNQGLDLEESEKNANKELEFSAEEILSAIDEEKEVNSNNVDVMKGQVIDKANSLSSNDKTNLFQDLGWSKTSRRGYYELFQIYVASDNKTKEMLPKSAGTYADITTFANSDEYREYQQLVNNISIPKKQDNAFHKHTPDAIEFILAQTDVDNIGSLKRDSLREIIGILKVSVTKLTQDFLNNTPEIATPEGTTPENDVTKKKEPVYVQVKTILHNTSIMAGFPRYEWDKKTLEFKPHLNSIEAGSGHHDKNFINWLSENNYYDEHKVVPISKKQVNETKKALTDSIMDNTTHWEAVYKKIAKCLHPDAGGSDQDMKLINVMKAFIESVEGLSKNKKRRSKAIEDYYSDYAEEFNENFFDMLELAKVLNSISGQKIDVSSVEYTEYIEDKKKYDNLIGGM